MSDATAHDGGPAAPFLERRRRLRMGWWARRRFGYSNSDDVRATTLSSASR